MKPYSILDGYNLIGALDRYRHALDLGTSRELLISDALKAAGWMGREIIVVFDTAKGFEPGQTELKTGGAVSVVYSAPKESADDVIERLVGSLDGPVTVYTADFALQRAVLARGGTRSTPREFEELLNELPAFTSTPDVLFSSRVAERLPPGVVQSLEELRRRNKNY